jgi:hypothetical protein
VADQVNASENEEPDQPVDACLIPSQLLAAELLRRLVESAQAAPVGGGSDARFVTREGRTARRLHAEREQAAQARWMVWWNCA